MIIQSYNHCYEVIRELDRTSRITEFVCKEQQQQEAYLLVKIAESTLAKRFTLFLEKKVKGSGFTDFKECFWWNGAFYSVYTYSSGRTLADKLATGHCERKERAEIVRRLLEQLLLRRPHPYFMRNALQSNMITVTDSLDVDWNYHLDEVRTFDYCTIKAVDIRLMEVMQLIFEEELIRRQYPLLDQYLSALGEGKMSDYLELYREFMPVYQALCEDGQEQLQQTFPQRLWEVYRKIGEKPDSLKGYLHLGKKYVAKKMAIVFFMLMVLLMVLLSLAFVWIVYPWIQSRFLTKTMVIHSQDIEGYTGRVRLVGDLETDNVIFVGTMTEGQFNGQGTLYDWDGNLIYRGKFLANQYSGMGESFYQNGKVQYSGEFAGGLYEGTGKLYQEDGILLYEGDFSRGLYEGNGILYYPDGQIKYRGSFSQGLFEGVGVLFYENGGTSYEGEFLQGKRSGSGKAYDESGELVYDGSFSRGLYDGNGILYYSDDRIQYSGSFSQGQFEGIGVLFYENGTVSYEGEFLQGKRSGSGKAYDESGELVYDGAFSQDRYEGEGILYENGEVVGQGRFHRDILTLGTATRYDDQGNLLYQGGIKNDLFDGEGKVYDPVSGYLVYKGNFREGQYDGYGKKYVEGILVYDGEFFQGKYCGMGTQYDQDTGTVTKGIFNDDQLVYILAEPNQETEGLETTEAKYGAE